MRLDLFWEVSDIERIDSDCGSSSSISFLGVEGKLLSFAGAEGVKVILRTSHLIFNQEALVLHGIALKVSVDRLTRTGARVVLQGLHLVAQVVDHLLLIHYDRSQLADFRSHIRFEKITRVCH